MSLLTADEVAVLMRCSVYTIRRRCADGTIPCQRFAGRLLIDEADLPRRLERRQGPPPPPKPRAVRGRFAELVERMG